MSNALHELGRQDFLDAAIDWNAANNVKAMLMDLGTADVAVKAIASSTNATPIVVTSTAHGFTNGDIVMIQAHVTNTCANGIWAITGVAANTFNLTDPITAGNVVGNGVGGATGYAVCLGPSAAGDFLDDYDGTRVGTDVVLTSPTLVQGVADAADTTFTAVTGASVEAVLVYRDSGAANSSRPICIVDGRQIVVCAAQAAASATSVAVERLVGAIPNATVLAFSNGASATLSALANAGDRTLTVSALAAIITAASRADAPVTASGLPITPNGGNIVISWPNSGPWGSATGIFKL